MTTPKEMALQYLQSMGFSDADSGTHHGSAFRLKGFDAPETAKADGRPDEPFAVEAMTELERQIAASDGGTIEQVQDRDRVDVYGRKLSVLRGNDGRDINAAMAVSGFTHPRSDAHALAMQALTRTSFGDKFGSEQHAAARVLGDEATALRSSLPFQNDLKVRGQREENPFFPAVRRGTDQLHAMSYGALNALGGVLGNDWMERVGAEGVARNLKAAARNPAKIEAWDDVDSMDKFMTFVVEALGEQLPQLAGDAAAALLGGGVGGVMARRSVAKSLVREFGDEAYGRFLAGGGATLSERAMKRRMGEEGLKEFAADATGAKALNYAAQQGAKTGAKAAAFGSMYSQVAGETQLELQREGIDAPGTALLTGIPKAITEYSSLMFGIDRIAKAFHATPTSILDLVGKVAANAGLSGMVEGSEEGLQTLMDFTAVKLEKGENPLSLSPAEARELRTAIAKGALIGTALGGGGTLASGTASYALDTARDQNETPQQTPAALPGAAAAPGQPGATGATGPGPGPGPGPRPAGGGQRGGPDGFTADGAPYWNDNEPDDAWDDGGGQRGGPDGFTADGAPYWNDNEPDDAWDDGSFPGAPEASPGFARGPGTRRAAMRMPQAETPPEPTDTATDPEPLSDLQAQYKALRNGGKPAMWVSAAQRAALRNQLVRAAERDGIPALVEPDGSLMLSSDETALQRYRDRGAQAAERAALLGYHQDKSQLRDVERAEVLQVSDLDGNVLHDEVVDHEQVPAARAALKRRFPGKSYQITTTTAADALARRQQLIGKEQAAYEMAAPEALQQLPQVPPPMHAAPQATARQATQATPIREPFGEPERRPSGSPFTDPAQAAGQLFEPGALDDWAQSPLGGDLRVDLGDVGRTTSNHVLQMLLQQGYKATRAVGTVAVPGQLFGTMKHTTAMAEIGGELFAVDQPQSEFLRPLENSDRVRVLTRRYSPRFIPVSELEVAYRTMGVLFTPTAAPRTLPFNDSDSPKGSQQATDQQATARQAPGQHTPPLQAATARVDAQVAAGQAALAQSEQNRLDAYNRDHPGAPPARSIPAEAPETRLPPLQQTPGEELHDIATMTREAPSGGHTTVLPGGQEVAPPQGSERQLTTEDGGTLAALAHADSGANEAAARDGNLSLNLGRERVIVPGQGPYTSTNQDGTPRFLFKEIVNAIREHAPEALHAIVRGGFRRHGPLAPGETGNVPADTGAGGQGKAGAAGVRRTGGETGRRSGRAVHRTRDGIARTIAELAARVSSPVTPQNVWRAIENLENTGDPWANVLASAARNLYVQLRGMGAQNRSIEAIALDLVQELHNFAEYGDPTPMMEQAGEVVNDITFTLADSELFDLREDDPATFEAQEEVDALEDGTDSDRAGLVDEHMDQSAINIIETEVNPLEIRDLDDTIESYPFGKAITEARATELAEGMRLGWPTYDFEVVESGEVYTNKKTGEQKPLFKVLFTKAVFDSLADAVAEAKRLAEFYRFSDFVPHRVEQGRDQFVLVHQALPAATSPDVIDDNLIFYRGFAKAVDNGHAARNSSKYRPDEGRKLLVFRRTIDPETDQPVPRGKQREFTLSAVGIKDMAQQYGWGSSPMGEREQNALEYLAGMTLLLERGYVPVSPQAIETAWFTPTDEPFSLQDLARQQRVHHGVAAVLPMYYKTEAVTDLRADLRDRYPKGTPISTLVADGVRTATTRNTDGLEVGDKIAIEGVPGRFRITAILKVDLDSPEGRARWEAREGWSAEAAAKRWPKQVHSGAKQVVFEPIAVLAHSPALARGEHVADITVLEQKVERAQERYHAAQTRAHHARTELERRDPRATDNASQGTQQRQGFVSLLTRIARTREQLANELRGLRATKRLTEQLTVLQRWTPQGPLSAQQAKQKAQLSHRLEARYPVVQQRINELRAALAALEQHREQAWEAMPEALQKQYRAWEQAEQAAAAAERTHSALDRKLMKAREAYQTRTRRKGHDGLFDRDDIEDAPAGENIDHGVVGDPSKGYDNPEIRNDMDHEWNDPYRAPAAKTPQTALGQQQADDRLVAGDTPVEQWRLKRDSDGHPVRDTRNPRKNQRERTPDRNLPLNLRGGKKPPRPRAEASATDVMADPTVDIRLMPLSNVQGALRSLAGAALSAMRLLNPHTILMMRHVDPALLTKAGLAPDSIAWVREQFAQGVRGLHFYNPADGAVLILINQAYPHWTQMLALAHELGHSAYLHVLKDVENGKGARYTAAKKAFAADRATVKDDKDHQWHDANGFEEWFADKYAAWLLNRVGTAGTPATKARTSVLDHWFQVILSKLRSLMQTLSAELKKPENAAWAPRFSSNKTFDQTFDQMVREVGAGALVKLQQQRAASGRALRIQQTAAWRMAAPAFTRLRQTTLVRTGEQLARNTARLGLPLTHVDYQLRELGAHRLADFFQQRSSSGGYNWVSRTGDRHSYNRLKTDEQGRVSAALNALEKQHGRAAMDAAAQRLAVIDPGTVVNWAQETEAARALRQWLDEHWAWLKQRMPTLGRIDNYSPTYNDVDAIRDRTQEYADILVAFRAVDTQDQALKAAKSIIDGNDPEMGLNLLERSRAPGMMHSRRRMLYGRLPGLRQALQNAGFYRPATMEGIHAYAHKSVARATFENLASDYFPLFSDIQSLMQSLDPEARIRQRLLRMAEDWGVGDLAQPGFRAQSVSQMVTDLHNAGFLETADTFASQMRWYSPTLKMDRLLRGVSGRAQEARALTLVKAQLGQLGHQVDPTLRNAAGWVQVAQNYLVLLFSPLSSLVDYAGPILRTREVGMAWKALGTALTKGTSADLRTRAEALGIIGQRMTHQIMNDYFGMSFFSDQQARANELLFKWNGQEALTNHTRVIALAVGEAFLQHHAGRAATGDARSQRYLDELNVTATEVHAWRAAGTLEGHDAVRHALLSYVDQSVLRPNSALRPAWASSGEPHHMLLWHLKSFYYAYGAVILGGIGREVSARRAEGAGLPAQALPVALAALTMLPLAALGLALRERIKWDDEAERPTSSMTRPEYLWELARRAGALGPLELALSATDRPSGDAAVASLAGPAASHLHTLITGNGDRVKRSTPILGQVPRFWDAIGWDQL